MSNMQVTLVAIVMKIQNGKAINDNSLATQKARLPMERESVT